MSEEKLKSKNGFHWQKLFVCNVFRNYIENTCMDIEHLFGLMIKCSSRVLWLSKLLKKT